MIVSRSLRCVLPTAADCLTLSAAYAPHRNDCQQLNSDYEQLDMYSRSTLVSTSESSTYQEYSTTQKHLPAISKPAEGDRIEPNKQLLRGNFDGANSDQSIRGSDPTPQEDWNRVKRKCSFEIDQDWDRGRRKGWARPPAEGSWDKVSCVSVSLQNRSEFSL